LARKNTRSRGSSTKPPVEAEGTYILCVDNSAYPASLDVRKLYLSLPDPDAEAVGMVRVIDESGESYLFPRQMFRRLKLPPAIVRALSAA